jgi:hypothetical protein
LGSRGAFCIRHGKIEPVVRVEVADRNGVRVEPARVPTAVEDKGRGATEGAGVEEDRDTVTGAGTVCHDQIPPAVIVKIADRNGGRATSSGEVRGRSEGAVAGAKHDRNGSGGVPIVVRHGDVERAIAVEVIYGDRARVPRARAHGVAGGRGKGDWALSVRGHRRRAEQPRGPRDDRMCDCFDVPHGDGSLCRETEDCGGDRATTPSRTARLPSHTRPNDVGVAGHQRRRAIRRWHK